MNDASLLRNQRERKEVRMSYWLLKLLSRDMKTKQKTKNKKKAMARIAPAMNHYPRNGWMEIPILNLLCHVKPGIE